LEEVANLVIFLASDVAFLVKGMMTEIDGGQERSLMDGLLDR
jgi:enoyl-[acyl-carrier-protein] reductase (NADH)